MLAKKYTLQIYIDDEFYNPVEDSYPLTIDRLSLVHIFMDDDLTLRPSINFYRFVKIQDECATEDYCVLQGCSCDEIVLPPGDYEVQICGGSSKFMPNGLFEIDLVVEEMTDAMVTAMTLNGDCDD